MRVQFGEIPASQLKPGTKVRDNDNDGREATVTDTYRETPDGSDHSGLFGMFVALDNGILQPVEIGEGDTVARFDAIG